MTETSDQGLWWLPGHEDTPVAGTLVLAADAFPRLELIGAFHDFGLADTEFSPEIILGVAGGKVVTLYRCLLAGTQLQMPGTHTERYVAHFVLKGAHFPTADSIVFAAMAVEYDALFEWAGLSGIRTKHKIDEKSHLVALDAHFQFPEAPAFSVAGARLSLITRVATQGGPHSRTVKFKQDVSLSVVPDAPLRLEEYLTRYLHDLANFMTLAVGAPVRTTLITGTLPVPDGEGSRHPVIVEVIFLGRDQHVTGEKRRWDMLFTLSDLGTEAEQALRFWLQRAEPLRAIYDLYFGTLFQQGAYVHQRFLTLAQALESYHRQTIPGRHLAEDAFAEILQKLTRVVDDARAQLGRDVAEAFLNKLKYFNEVSLRRRLKELVSARRSLVSLLIRDEKRFVKRVVNTRNYYTHYDSESQALAVGEDDLHLLSDQMQFLLELCLLAELGLQPATIDALIRRHQRYQGLMRRLESFDPAT